MVGLLGLLCRNDCCLDITLSEDLTLIPADYGPRRFLATPLHEIMGPRQKATAIAKA